MTNYATSLRDWKDRVSHAVFSRLAEAFNRTALLQIIRGAESKSGRRATPARAIRIEKFVDGLRESDPSIPRLLRGNIARTCESCEHWLASRGAMAVAKQTGKEDSDAVE